MQDRARFVREMRDRNISLILWCGIIFSPFYLAWYGFDLLLVPDHASVYLRARIAVAVVSLVLAVAAHRSRRYTFEAFALWFTLYSAGVCWMAPSTGSAYLPYVIGYSIIASAAAILPFWPPAWAIGTAGVSSGMMLAVTWWAKDALSMRDVVTATFFLPTTLAVNAVIAWFKDALLYTDFERRSAFEGELKAARESVARVLPRQQELSGLLDSAEIVWRPAAIAPGDCYLLLDVSGTRMVLLASSGLIGVAGSLASLAIVAAARRVAGRLDSPSPRALVADVQQELLLSGADLANVELGALVIRDDQISVSNSGTVLFESVAGATQRFEDDREIRQRPSARYFFCTGGLAKQPGSVGAMPLGVVRLERLIDDAAKGPRAEQCAALLRGLDAYRGSVAQARDFVIIAWSSSALDDAARVK